MYGVDGGSCGSCPCLSKTGDRWHACRDSFQTGQGTGAGIARLPDRALRDGLALQGFRFRIAQLPLSPSIVSVEKGNWRSGENLGITVSPSWGSRSVSKASGRLRSFSRRSTTNVYSPGGRTKSPTIRGEFVASPSLARQNSQQGKSGTSPSEHVQNVMLVPLWHIFYPRLVVKNRRRPAHRIHARRAWSIGTICL